MLKALSIILFGGLFAVLSTEGHAQREQIFVGTRPLSMGEAFVAVADDGNAIYWNPAGLSRMERIQASFNYSDLFGLGIKSYYASFISRLYFIPPLTDYLSLGVDWFRLQFGDDELDFDRNQINFSLAFKPPKSLPFLRDFGFGLNAKYLSLGSKLDGSTEVDADGWGIDFGLLYDLSSLPIVPNGLNFGLMVHDVSGTSITHITGVNEEILPQNIRWGLSYRPFENWPWGNLPISDPVFALDFDDRIHFGLEVWLERILALRMGIQKDLHTDEKMTFSFGVGFKLHSKTFPDVTADYALIDSPVLPNTIKQFGGSIIIKENPRLLRIEGAHINDVFSSLHHYYGRRGANVGKIKIKNEHSETLKARISFQASRYMKTATQDTLFIEPGRTVDFPLRAVFEPEIIDAHESRLTGEIKVNYNYKRSEFVSVAAVDFALYGKNYITWDDPGKAAAFVTINDPGVRKFVNQASSIKTEDKMPQWFFHYSMTNALTLYEALQAYGVNYRLDPVTPFPSLADTLRGAHYRLDTIQYPSEFLSAKKRFGDCDDLSVLYASLLQQAGFETALVSGPGHIFMMFNTSIPASRVKSLPVKQGLFKIHNATLWIPIEATMIPSSGFVEAWQTAAERLDPANDKSWEIYEVAIHQSKYPPISVPFKDYALMTLDIDSALQRDSLALNLMKKQYLQTFVDSLKQELPFEDKIRIRNHYGALLGQIDDYDGAKEQFEIILAMDSTNASALNNLGNVEFIMGSFAQADTLYKIALDSALYRHGTYLNLAILYQMMIIGASPQDSAKYEQRSEEYISEAARLFLGDEQFAFALLGYPEEQIVGKAAGFMDKIRSGIRKVKNFVDKSFKKHIKKDKRKVALDRHGAKGQGEIDEDRWALLWWSY